MIQSVKKAMDILTVLSENSDEPIMLSELAEKTGLPVDFSDERGTTITAHGFLNETNTRGKRRKATVDAVAATIILQDYLDYRRNRKG